MKIITSRTLPGLASCKSVWIITYLGWETHPSSISLKVVISWKFMRWTDRQVWWRSRSVNTLWLHYMINSSMMVFVHCNHDTSLTSSLKNKNWLMYPPITMTVQILFWKHKQSKPGPWILISCKTYLLIVTLVPLLPRVRSQSLHAVR